MMKNKILAIILILTLVVGIPLINVHRGFIIKTKEKTEKKASYSVMETAAYYFKEEYCDETLKAIAIFANANAKVKKDKTHSINKTEFQKKYKNGSNYYSKIEKYCNNFKNIGIFYKNKPKFTPLTAYSSGYISPSKTAPHLCECACPWDEIAADGNSQSGAVSLNSLNELCKNGSTAEEAVMYFLEEGAQLRTERG